MKNLVKKAFHCISKVGKQQTTLPKQAQIELNIQRFIQEKAISSEKLDLYFDSHPQINFSELKPFFKKPMAYVSLKPSLLSIQKHIDKYSFREAQMLYDFLSKQLVSSKDFPLLELIDVAEYFKVRGLLSEELLRKLEVVIEINPSLILSQ